MRSFLLVMVLHFTQIKVNLLKISLNYFHYLKFMNRNRFEIPLFLTKYVVCNLQIFLILLCTSFHYRSEKLSAYSYCMQPSGGEQVRYTFADHDLQITKPLEN